MQIGNGEKYHSLTLKHHCGGGAYGEVYFAEDISGRQFAVKIVSKEKLGDHWQQELKGVRNYRKITENAPELLQFCHVEEDEIAGTGHLKKCAKCAALLAELKEDDDFIRILKESLHLLSGAADPVRKKTSSPGARESAAPLP